MPMERDTNRLVAARDQGQEEWEDGCDAEGVTPGSSFMVVVMQNHTCDKIKWDCTHKYTHANECMENFMKSEGIQSS